MDTATWDTLRLANAILCGAVLVGMALRFRFWRAQEPIVKLLLNALGVLVFAAGYGSLEAALGGDVPGGARVAVVTIAMVWALVAIFLARTAPRVER